MDKYYEDRGCCSCHISAPCSFCVSMTEEEADIYWNGGEKAFREHLQKQNQNEPDPKTSS